MPWIGGAIAGGLGLLGSSMAGNSAEAAANTSAQAQLEAARLAAEAAKFRPVGITTRFGTSNFQMSPEGYLQSAGYNISPELATIQDRLMSQAGGQGVDFTGQGLKAAQSLFNLGQQFLPTSTQYEVNPEATQYAAALRGLGQQALPTDYDITKTSQDLYNQLEALQQSGREKTLAGVRQNLFNTGRGGVAVAQGGDLGAANPEMQAYYNALLQSQGQNAVTARNQAQTELQNRIQTGSGLLANALQAGTTADEQAYQRMLSNLQTGSGLFGTGAQAATAGYSPLQTGLGLAETIEKLGQSPLDIGAQLGGRTATAGASVGNALLQGGLGAAKTMQTANAYNPLASTISGLANNQQFTSGLAGLFGSSGYSNPLSGANLSQWTNIAGVTPGSQQDIMLRNQVL